MSPRRACSTRRHSLYKHDEWERYSVYISQWEVEEYLRFF